MRHEHAMPPTAEEKKARPKSARGQTAAPVLPSILFWLALFASVGLFSAVVLSPKLVAVALFEQRLADLESRQYDVERRNAYLKRVGDALEHDPQFAAEVARYELGARELNEERIAVKPALPNAPDAPHAQGSTFRWIDPRWLPLAERLVEDRLASNLCLVLAGGLAVVAFAFFSPSTSRFTA